MSIDRVSISAKSVITLFLCLLIILCLVKIQSVLTAIFIAFILMSGMHAVAQFLMSHHLPKTLSNFLALIAFFSFLILLVWLVIPPLIDELLSAIKQFSLPPEIETMIRTYHFELDNLQTFTSPLAALPQLSHLLMGVIAAPVKVIVILILAFTLLQERDRLWRLSLLFNASHKTQTTIKRVIDQVETQLGFWIVGELTLMTIIGVGVTIGLSFLHVRYALALGVLAGLFEILPNLGPILSITPALIIAFVTGSWPMVLGVLILFTIMHQLENHLVVPIVMRQAVGFSPVITIPLLLIGNQLGGAGGAILALPLALTVKIILNAIFIPKT